MNDFIELEKKLLHDSPISKHSLRTELERELGEEFNNENEDNEGINSIENQLNDKFGRYLELVDLLGDRVFKYDEIMETITFSDTFIAKPEYLLCLECMGDNNQQLSSLFEKCSAEAIKTYLGEGAKYKLIDDVQKQTIDFKKFCDEELFESNHSDTQKDFKDSEKIPRCDIIVWKPLDKMSGKVILLVQCKTGKNWKDSHPVNLRVWTEKLIDFACKPISVYTITDLIDRNKAFIDQGKEKGLILDRARIIRLLATVGTEEIKKVRKEIGNLLN